MDMRRASLVVLLVLIGVFAVSFLISLQRYKSVTYWLVRPLGQFHTVQALDTPRPTISEPVDGGLKGRYALARVRDHLVMIHEVAVPVPREEEGEARKLSSRYHMVLRENEQGGYDLVHSVTTLEPLDGHPNVKELIKEKNPENWSVIVRDYLMPVSDLYVLEAVKSRLSDGTHADRLMQAEFERNADEIVLYLAEMDSALRSDDLDRLRGRMDKFEERFSESRPEFVAEIAGGYREWIELKEKSGFVNVADTLALIGTDRQSGAWLSVSDMHDAFLSVSADSVYIPRDRFSSIGNSGGTSSLLNWQVASKVMRVRADMAAISGDFEAAVDWIFPVHRASMVLVRESPNSIETLIGIACGDIAIGGMENLFLNLPTATDVEELWPRLNAAAALHLAITAPKSFSMEAKASGVVRNMEEMSVRHDVARAKMAALRSGAASWHHYLVSGRFPTAGENPGELMPGGIDADPFGKRLQMAEIEGGLAIYSVGPDRKDNRASVEYDPTNGTVSGGDIRVRLFRDRKYPLKREPDLSTADAIHMQFPNGLPPDPFADSRGRGYSLSDESPANIWSFGPDTDERDGGTVPEVDYDPTNGIISSGDIVSR